MKMLTEAQLFIIIKSVFLSGVACGIDPFNDTLTEKEFDSHVQKLMDEKVAEIIKDL